MADKEKMSRSWQDPAAETGHLLLRSPTDSSVDIVSEDNSSRISNVLPTPLRHGRKFFNLSLGSDCGGICRICHEGDSKERLISPCKCSGTMGLIHRSCMETWLGMAGVTQCELCGYQLSIRREPKEFLEWVRNPSTPQDRKNIKADIICFMMLTPLAAISCWLCISGAIHYTIDDDHSELEAIGLVTLTVFLLLIYMLWCLIAVRYHHRVWKEWRQNNQNIFLELSTLVSTTITSDENNNNNLALQANTASLSSREQDESQPASGLCQCNRRRILSSTPRFTRLPNQSVHLCYCGYVPDGSTQLAASEASLRGIHALRHVCACGAARECGRRERLKGCDAYGETRGSRRPSELKPSSSEVFRERDPIGADPWRSDLVETYEAVASGARQWVVNSQSSDESTSPDKSVTFHISEEQRSGGQPWVARSSTPTKGEHFQGFKGGKVKCALSSSEKESASPSCTDALLDQVVEDSDTWHRL